MTGKGFPSLRFLTHNVNGMRGKDRRRTLFTTLMDDGYDVIALQETHEAANTPVRARWGDTAIGAAGDGTAVPVFSEGQEWAKEGAGPTRPWPGTAFWAPGVEGSRGVALLFSAKAVEDLEPALLTADPQGRYISASCTSTVKPSQSQPYMPRASQRSGQPFSPKPCSRTWTRRRFTSLGATSTASRTHSGIRAAPGGKMPHSSRPRSDVVLAMLGDSRRWRMP